MAGEKQFDSKGSTIYVYGESGLTQKSKIIFNGEVFWKKIWTEFLKIN